MFSCLAQLEAQRCSLKHSELFLAAKELNAPVQFFWGTQSGTSRNSGTQLANLFERTTLVVMKKIAPPNPLPSMTKPIWFP